MDKKQQKKLDGELLKAVYLGDVEKTEQCLAAGADVNTRNNSACGTAALHWAAHRNRADCVKLLVNAGADTDIRDYGGETAMMQAARAGNDGILKILIEAGADINTQDYSGNTSLHIAAHKVKTECVRTLIEAGADTAIADEYGSTALHWAAKSGYIYGPMLFLIKAGADTDAKDVYGRTPLDILKKKYPRLYEQHISELYSLVQTAQKLRSEDKAQPAHTGFEFDI